MTTTEINTTRLHLFNGEFATEVVAATRERLQAQPRRVIAIGRSENGQPFRVIAPAQRPVQAPADFAEAVAEVDSRRVTPVQISAEALAEIEDEVIGEDFSRKPWLY